MAPLIGTAGWSIDREARPFFPSVGSSLERYASIFPAVEVNSSFHRPHRLSTWQKWREAVPAAFRFSVKIPKTVSHEHRLVGCSEALDSFVAQVCELGDKLGALLLQLPPSLHYDRQTLDAFLREVSARRPSPIACEPRHASWFSDEADAHLRDVGVARVAADPARHPGADTPGGWRGLSYFRLHGSPVIYRSSYGMRLHYYAEQVRKETQGNRPTWCIFDNTASSAALTDAVQLMQLVSANCINRS